LIWKKSNGDANMFNGAYSVDVVSVAGFKFYVRLGWPIMVA